MILAISIKSSIPVSGVRIPHGMDQDPAHTIAIGLVRDEPSGDVSGTGIDSRKYNDGDMPNYWLSLIGDHRYRL